jgi:hypothetical protein
MQGQLQQGGAIEENCFTVWTIHDENATSTLLYTNSAVLQEKVLDIQSAPSGSATQRL